MKIGILQIDGKMPNLALMQIAGYHEAQGHTVERYIKGGLFDSQYDKIYASKLFEFSKMPALPDKAIIGGTGIDFTNNLPVEIQRAKPSYTLYPKCNYHIGFSMKGCRLRCTFCCVPKKEGKAKANSNIDNLLLNPNGGNRLMLLDNDFFGGPDWRENLERIIELKLKVCFAQGLNIRIITPDQAEVLKRVNYQNTRFDQKYLTFAWDRFHDEKLIIKGIEICNKAGIPNRHMMFFVLIGEDKHPDTHKRDLHRLTTLASLGIRPYVMPYSHRDPYQKHLTRFVNHYAIFRKLVTEHGSVTEAAKHYEYYTFKEWD